MPKPRINLMIMREGEIDQEVRSFSLPGYLPRLGIVVGAVLVVLVTVACAGLIYLWHSADEARLLRTENEALRTSVVRVAQLESELEQHRRFTRRVAGLIGVEIPVFEDTLLASATGETPGYPDDSGGLDLHGVLTGTDPDNASPEAGALVINCRPDPNNRPRGLPVMGRLSRGFQPVAANPGLRHYGLDVAARVGSPVFAPASGTVIFAGEDSTFGLMLILDHGQGFKSVYGHNSKLLAKQGARISRADIIALSGNTGVSTAPHLHYEIRKDDQAVDPIGFLGR